MRYTGASLAYQTASTLGTGFTPTIASGPVLATGDDLWLVGLVWAVTFPTSATCVLATREGREVDLAGDTKVRARGLA